MRVPCGSTRASRPPSPGSPSVMAVPRLGVGVPRPVVGDRVVFAVRRGGPRAATGLRIRRRVDGARLPAQLPASAHVRGRARGAAARHRARSPERGGAPPVRNGSALVGSRLAAADMYGRALQLEPERPITLFNLGRVAARQVHYAEARRWADSALAIDPGADYAYVLRALAEFRLGKPAEARADAETAARLRSGFRVPGEAVLRTGRAAGRRHTRRAKRIERLEREIRSAGNHTITDAAWVGRRARGPTGAGSGARAARAGPPPRRAALVLPTGAGVSTPSDPIRGSPSFVAESAPE